MELKSGSTLQGGKYKIEKVLGKGGFGITYLAYQQGLNRYVAVKEFFMSEYCWRGDAACEVCIPSAGSRGIVEKYRSKFVKEAQTIATLDNSHILPIYDVFEENGTAYYVMKYIGGGSLNSLVGKGESLPLDVALKYVRQVAEALSYCHERNIAHLDVKPGNILIQDDVAVLIDFGISKHYNDGGEQTSSTPVGISKGYAPLEQYRRGGVTTFSPVTDIYSLGAVLFRLLTGQTPPDADEVNEDGLPEFPSDIPQYIQYAITAAMQPRKKDRPQSVEAFLDLLVEPALEDDEDLEYTIVEEPPYDVLDKAPANSRVKKVLRYIGMSVLLLLMAIICVVSGIYLWQSREEAKVDQRRYLALISSADSLSRNEADLQEAIALYDSAAVYERRYARTEFSGRFAHDARSRSASLQRQLEASKNRKYTVGDYYEKDGVRGIVCSVDTSGLHGVMVELYQSSECFAWCIDDAGTVRAFSREDGLSNMRKVQGQDVWEKRFPAFAYCASKGPGWYLPAIKELEIIIKNKTLLDQSLKEVGGDPILPNKNNGTDEWGWYWSSTEVGKGLAGRIGWSFDDGADCGVPDYHMEYGMTVRAVHKF